MNFISNRIKKNENIQKSSASYLITQMKINEIEHQLNYYSIKNFKNLYKIDFILLK